MAHNCTNSGRAPLDTPTAEGQKVNANIQRVMNLYSRLPSKKWACKNPLQPRSQKTTYGSSVRRPRNRRRRAAQDSIAGFQFRCNIENTIKDRLNDSHRNCGKWAEIELCVSVSNVLFATFSSKEKVEKVGYFFAVKKRGINSVKLCGGWHGLLLRNCVPTQQWDCHTIAQTAEHHHSTRQPQKARDKPEHSCA